MASGDEAGGKKRKASVVAEDVTSPATRDPRRGLGVAELERIRVALEMAERCYVYAATASSLSTAPHQPPPALPRLGMHATGVAATPAAHHQHVGSGAVHHQLQMTRSYLTPYYHAQHCYGNDSLNRLFTTNGGDHSSHQNHHSFRQNHYGQADQIQSPVTALFPRSDVQSSSSASQWRQCHRQAHAKPGQTTTALPQVAFVDLVDSDDDSGGDAEELDLELKL